MKKRIVLALVVSLVIFGAFYASAASLGVDGNFLQAGSDNELRCDLNGVQVDGWGLEVDTNTVANVKVVGVAPACNGADMFARVNFSDNTSKTLNKVTLIGDATTKHTFNFSAPFPTPAEIVGIELYIEGPNVVTAP